MITKEQEAALERLEANTDTFWTTAAAISIVEPFGLKWKPTYRADYSATIGLHRPRDISSFIASHLGANQVRADCQAIREVLGGEK